MGVQGAGKDEQEDNAVAVAGKCLFGVGGVDDRSKPLMRLDQIQGHGQRVVKIDKGALRTHPARLARSAL